MNHSQQADGEQEYWQEFDVEEGEYQYKFRLGPGDWWVLDETKDIVDDGAGNRNNRLVVEAPASKDITAQDSILDMHVMDQATAPIHHPEETTNHQSIHASDNQSVPTITADTAATTAPTTDEVHAESQNMFSHETLLPVPSSEQDQLSQDSLHSDIITSSPAEYEVQDDEDDEDDDQLASPLFRHESLAPIRTGNEEDGEEEEEAFIPLFRHESMSPLEARSHSSARSMRSNSASSHKSFPFDTEDIHDPSLEKFPTERDGIMAHLQRTSSRRADDETDFDGNPLSPSLSATRSLSDASSPSISMAKESSEHLDSIDEDEELSPEADDKEAASLQESKPELKLGLGIGDVSKPGDKLESASKFSVSPILEQVNRGPPTPPMTPIIDEPQAKSGARDGSLEDSSPKLDTPDTPRAPKDNSTDHIASPSTSKSTISSDEDKGTDSKPASFWAWFGRLCNSKIGTVGVAVAVGVAAALYTMAGRASSSKLRDVTGV